MNETQPGKVEGANDPINPVTETAGGLEWVMKSNSMEEVKIKYLKNMNGAGPAFITQNQKFDVPGFPPIDFKRRGSTIDEIAEFAIVTGDTLPESHHTNAVRKIAIGLLTEQLDKTNDQIRRLYKNVVDLTIQGE